MADTPKSAIPYLLFARPWRASGIAQKLSTDPKILHDWLKLRRTMPTQKKRELSKILLEYEQLIKSERERLMREAKEQEARPRRLTNLEKKWLARNTGKQPDDENIKPIV